MHHKNLLYLKSLAIFCCLLSPLFMYGDAPDWNPISNTAYNMDITANLYYPDGSISLSPNDIVGGFVGEECRGVASPFEYLDGAIFLSLASNQAMGETIHFKAYLADLDSIVDLNETVVFMNMGSFGTIEEPFALTINENIPPVYFDIVASSGNHGSISPVGVVNVVSGEDQIFLINPDEFYHIAAVLVDGVSAGTSNVYTFYSVGAAHTIHADFAIDTYTLTYLPGSNGSLSGNTTQTIAHGSAATAVTALPNAGFVFASWSDGSNQNPRTDLNVTANIEVTANFGQNLYTITADASGNGSISPMGQITVAEGSNQNFQITPNVGYHIGGVLVDDNNVGIPTNYTFENIQADHSIHASFEINTYTLSYAAGTDGTLQGETLQTVEHGSSGTAVLAVAETDFIFENWSDGSTNNPRTDSNVTSSISVTANYTATTGQPDWLPVPNLQFTMQVLAKLQINENIYSTNEYDLVAAFVGNECRGLTSPMGEYLFLSVGSNQSSGESITFKAHLSESNVVVNLNEIVIFQNMGEVGTFDNPYIFTIYNGIPPVYYTITASAGQHGSINPTGEVIAVEGSNQSFTINSDAGYQIEQIQVDGTAVGALSTYTFENVTATHTIHATFKPVDQNFTLVYLAGEGGTVDGELIQQVAAGGSGSSVNAIPNENYQFIAWSDGSTENPRTDENVSSNITVTANFSTSSGAPEWTPTPNLQFNMQILARVQLSDGSFATNTSDLVAGFVGSECRGVNSPLEGLNGMIFLTINSNQSSGENIYFKVYLADQNVVVNLNENIIFENLGEIGSFDEPFTFTLQQDQPPIYYTITATADANGAITPAGAVEVAEGNGQLFTIIPSYGYLITDVVIDGISAGAISSYEFVNVSSNHTIHASFALAPSYTLTYTADANGLLQGELVQQVPQGQNGTAVLAIPNSAYQFDHWSDGSTENPRTDENVSSNITVTASFTASSGAPEWTPTPNLQFNMQILARVQLSDGSFATNASDLVAGFVGSECRGVNSPLEGLNGMIFLTINSNQSSGENIYFKVYLADENAIVNLNENIIFENLGEIGNFDEPFTFTLQQDQPPIYYTITATADANGAITPSGAVEVAEGNGQLFTIIPGYGYLITDVVIDGISAGAISSYEFVNVSANHTIHASFALAPSYTLTYTAGTNGLLQGELVQQVPQGQNGTAVLAIANETYQFLHWTDGSTVNPRTDVNVTEDITVTAQFEPVPEIPDWNSPTNLQFNMAIVCKLQFEDGSISLSTNDLVAGFFNNQCRGVESPLAGLDGLIFLTIASNQASGELINFKAYIPDQNRIVDLKETINFVNLGEVGDFENPFIFTIKPNITKYEITATAGTHGSINPIGIVEVEAGDDQSFSMTPDEGYHIAEVKVGGVNIGTPASYTFENVTENHSISVSFELNHYTILASAGENGSITPDGVISVAHGSNQSFTISPNEGYHIEDVLIDGLSAGALGNYNFENVKENHAISASFAIDTFIVTASAGANGSIYPEGAIVVNYGSSQSFTFNPDEGYHISEVLVDGISVGVLNNYSFQNITADHSIFVSFEINTYTIMASAGANGTIYPLAGGGTENFDNLETTGTSYANGLFAGNDGSVWTFTQSRGDISLSGKALTLGRNRTPQANLHSGEIEGGIGILSFDYVQAFGTNINLSVLINDLVVANFTTSGEQNILKHSGPIEVNTQGIFTLQFISNNNSDGQVTIDNINWTGFGSGIILEHGSNQSFNFIPDVNYHVDDVLVDGQSIGSPNFYIFQNVTEDHTIHVDFAIDTYIITATAGDHGTITPAGEIIIEYGFEQNFNFFPEDTYHIHDVVVDGQSIGSPESYVFQNVTENHTIHVDFIINTYELVLHAADGNGVVSGAGTYGHGSMVSIEATPNEGYAFVNWTENNISVSEEATYNFAITSGRELTANFICTPDWNLQNNYAYTMQVVARLLIDGEISMNPFDKIGAFVGDECRGIGSPSVNINGLVFLSVASNVETGEVVKLRIWNSTACTELSAYPPFNFENMNLIGSIDAPYLVHNGKEQSLSFNEGFTWFSANVNPGNMHPNNLLFNLNPCANDRIIGQGDFALYNNTNGWVGSLTSIDTKKMYRMKLCQAQTIVISGAAAPIEPIGLSAGFTWVGYTPQECILVNEATANITPAPSVNDRITGQDKFALYNGSQWVGTLSTLCPGEGYVFKRVQAGSILYPESSGGKANLATEPVNDFTEVTVARNKAHTMMVVGEIVLDGQVLQNEADWILAYINGECVGAAAPMSFNNNKLFLNIGSDTETNEKVSFKVWLSEYKSLFDVAETLYFEAFGEAGDYNNPMQFHLEAVVGLDGSIVMQQAQVGAPYPNPFKTSTTIPYSLLTENQVSLRLINSNGMIVKTVEAGTLGAGDYQLHIKSDNLKPGIYLALIQFQGRNSFYQVIKSLIIN